jgi:large subunit ribosomal protein L9
MENITAMKVLLKEDVDNLGYAGEVHVVANGYGRNYLLPQGLAVIASPGMMKQANTWRKRAEARRAELMAEYQALAEQIADVRLTFTARAGETGKLYGSVTTAQITDALNEALSTEVDRRKVGIEPLRLLGEHKVIVRLSAEFQPELTVVIEAEEGTGPAAVTDEAEPEVEDTGVEDAVVEETVVEETVVEETVVEATVVEETVVEETVVEETVAEETVAEETVVEETVVEATVAEETAVEEVVVEATAAEETAEDDTIENEADEENVEE